MAEHNHEPKHGEVDVESQVENKHNPNQSTNSSISMHLFAWVMIFFILALSLFMGVKIAANNIDGFAPERGSIKQDVALDDAYWSGYEAGYADAKNGKESKKNVKLEK